MDELRADLELGKLIHRQAEKNSASEKREELWAASVRAYHAKRGEDLRLQWREHFKRMRAVHWGLGDEYDAKLKTLENEHEED